MSEEQENEVQLIQRVYAMAEGYPDTAILPYPLAVVDAHLFQFLQSIHEENDIWSYKRNILTLGSIEYIVTVDDRSEWMVFNIIAVGNGLYTDINVRVGLDAYLPNEPPHLQTNRVLWLWNFITRLRTSQDMIEERSRETAAFPSFGRTISPQPPIPKTSGRKQTEANRKAIRALQEGQRRASVLTTYMREISETDRAKADKRLKAAEMRQNKRGTK